MCVLGVRTAIKAQGVPEVEPGKFKALSAIAEARPDDVRTASIIAAATSASLELEKQSQPSKRALAR